MSYLHDSCLLAREGFLDTQVISSCGTAAILRSDLKFPNSLNNHPAHVHLSDMSLPGPVADVAN